MCEYPPTTVDRSWYHCHAFSSMIDCILTHESKQPFFPHIASCIRHHQQENNYKSYSNNLVAEPTCPSHFLPFLNEDLRAILRVTTLPFSYLVSGTQSS